MEALPCLRELDSPDEGARKGPGLGGAWAPGSRAGSGASGRVSGQWTWSAWGGVAP